jgi:hypothetical protein
MPIAFKTTNIQFQNVQGRQTETQTVPFTSDVVSAETAVRGFNFDFRTADRNVDKVEVTTRKRSQNKNVVEVEASVIYADQSRDDDYSCTVNVLVIAEVV